MIAPRPSFDHRGALPSKLSAACGTAPVDDLENFGRSNLDQPALSQKRVKSLPFPEKMWPKRCELSFLVA